MGYVKIIYNCSTIAIFENYRKNSKCQYVTVKLTDLAIKDIINKGDKDIDSDDKGTSKPKKMLSSSI